MSGNTSVQMLTLVWNEKRFVESRSARQAARRSIFRAANTLLHSQYKTLESQNEEIQQEIHRCYSDLHKYDDKLQVLDNMTQLATHSLEHYFQKRMENLRAFVSEQCRTISDGIQEEADHWKEIHAMLQQKLVVPGDLRSYGGGNGLPRAVRQSPNISQIAEEDEDVEEEKHDMSTLLQSRTLTPLITQTLKKARLLTSKLSQDASISVPTQLPDVSAIEKETEEEGDLSMSLLPFVPTINPPIDEEDNKSMASAISDKTFVKTSLQPFSSDEDDGDEEDEDTVIEESMITDPNEIARPLLLTADRSIRRPAAPVISPDSRRAEEPSVFKIPAPPKCEPPIAEEVNVKRRTTRLFRESQNDNLVSQAPVELPMKPRYATRSSTRLAVTTPSEEVTRRTTVHRRTTRFTSD